MNPLHPRPRTLRLSSGLVLLAFVATHLLNHAAGLFSLDAAEAGRALFVGFWRSLPATVAFYGALLLHFALALSALYERRSLRMPALELARIALGFAIPLLLATHAVQTRLLWELGSVEDDYTRVAASIWISDSTLRQLALVTVVWLHGCFGVHLALRHRAAYRRWQPWLIPLATLLPALGFTGYVAMARELASRAPPAAAPSDVAPLLDLATEVAFYLPLALLAFVLTARWAQLVWARRQGRLVRIGYPGASVQVPAGFSVLEASRAHDIPHLSVCGGRARCSTCRVRVESGAGEQPPPGPDEAKTLERIGNPPGVRLACQLRPTADLQVRPLLAARGAGNAFEPLGGPTEREVVVLFADLRRWTGLAEQQLPFDLVYVLDQYFEAVGDAVRESGGIPNQFIGDSVMALFGLDTDPATAAKQALRATSEIERRMAAVNEGLAVEFRRPLDFGIGIHAGNAAVGTVGYRDTRTLSAVGDAVNTASRIQELTKILKVRVVVSEEVLQRAGHPPGDWQRHEVPIRGREGKMVVYALSTFCTAGAPQGLNSPA